MINKVIYSAIVALTLLIPGSSIATDASELTEKEKIEKRKQFYDQHP